MEKKHYKLVTHNLNFHADDVFACAMLAIMIERAGGTWEVARTRDTEAIAAADIVFDVGMVSDPKILRFDHHQKEGAGTHADGTPYASCGLVWKEYGLELCENNQKVFDRIEQKLIAPIDAEDNGVSLVTSVKDLTPFTLQDVLYLSRPSWKEDLAQNDTGFLEQVAFARKLLERVIKKELDTVSGDGFAEADYEKAEDKRLIITEGNYPVSEFLETKHEPLYVVRQNTDGSGWRVLTVRKFPNSFENRKDFPKAWGGLREDDLARVSGVPDATFCHNGLWLAVAKSREGALALAKMALLG